MSTARNDLSTLLYGNRVLVTNLLFNDARRLDKLVREYLETGGDEGHESVMSTRRDAEFRRQLAEEILSLMDNIGDD